MSSTPPQQAAAFPTIFALNQQLLLDVGDEFQTKLASTCHSYSFSEEAARLANDIIQLREQDLVRAQQIEANLQMELGVCEANHSQKVHAATIIQGTIAEKNATLSLLNAEYEEQFKVCTALLAAPGHSMEQCKVKFDVLFAKTCVPLGNQITAIKSEIHACVLLELQCQKEDDEETSGQGGTGTTVAEKHSQFEAHQTAMAQLQALVTEGQRDFEVQLADLHSRSLPGSGSDLDAKDAEIQRLQAEIDTLRSGTFHHTPLKQGPRAAGVYGASRLFWVAILYIPFLFS